MRKIIKGKRTSFSQKFLLQVQEHGGESIIPFNYALERNLVDMPDVKLPNIMSRTMHEIL